MHGPSDNFIYEDPNMRPNKGVVGSDPFCPICPDCQSSFCLPLPLVHVGCDRMQDQLVRTVALSYAVPLPNLSGSVRKPLCHGFCTPHPFGTPFEYFCTSNCGAFQLRHM
jgi:hypothetical protein